MITLPKEFSKQISAFAPLFRKKVFEHVKVLLLGSLIAVGRRTVCGDIRCVGLSEEARFHKYHRVLSRAKLSCLRGAKLLLGLLIDAFTENSEPLIFGVIHADFACKRGTRKPIKTIFQMGVLQINLKAESQMAHLKLQT